MDTPGTIANRVARRYCEGPHEGASPCDTCAIYRAIAIEAMDELAEDLEFIIKLYRRGALRQRRDEQEVN